ncbi:MAG: hypothetical protein ABSF81_02670 [Bacteroidales bacterium]
MEKTGWAYISTIVSITLGWFLNELSQWFRTRKEDKKVIKRVLYNLLETYFIFNQLNTSDLIHLLTDRLLIRFLVQGQSLEAKDYLNKLFSEIIDGFIKDDIVDRLKRIEIGYTYSIEELAAVDPITAYRLNGKIRIIETFDILQEHIKEKVTQSAELNVQFQDQIESIKPQIINDAIEDLEDEIIAISFSINILTWIKAKNTLKRIKGRIKKDGEKKMDELLNKFLPK